jgi:RimJ/RimL family protein N-acetyltransferase
MPFLYSLATASETGFRWRYRGAFPTQERFVADFWGQVLTQFLVVDAKSNENLGLVVCYEAELAQGYAYVGAVFSNTAIRRGCAPLAVQMFMDYLFLIHPLRKLYLEVPEWNMETIRSGTERSFAVEGVLRSHDYYAGRHWDRYILAIYRHGKAPFRPSDSPSPRS